jgi:hypothetical protein
MSEFCAHVEQALGWTSISYEDSKKIHAQGCGICSEIRAIVRAEGITPAEAERRILGRNVAYLDRALVRSRIDRLMAFFGHRP